MPSILIYIGKNKDIPEEYHEQYFALRQQSHEELYGFLPANIEYYRNMWNVPREIGSDRIKAIAVNESNFVIGYGFAIWNTMYENLDRAWFGIYVVPSERRKGVGSKILKEFNRVLPQAIKVLASEAPVETPGEYFLKKFKEEPGYVEEIVLADLEEAVLDDVKVEAKKQTEIALTRGYKIVRVNDRNYKAHFDEEEFVKIVEQIWNDMPREELTEEDMNLTVERHQDIYDRNKKTGLEYVSFVVVHIETDKPVGFTTYAINKYQPGVAWQDDTGIIPEHRGKGLGLAVKYQSLLTLIEESSVKYWRTSSSQKNKFMYNINKTLGHKLWQKEPVYEIERKTIEELLS